MDKSDSLRDFMTWYLCYEQGLRPPRYAVPAIPAEAKWYPARDGQTTLCVINRVHGEWHTYTGWWSNDHA